MISLVIFSKDRAMQLDSLLRSVKDHCTGIDRVAVLAQASSNLHEDAYIKLGEEHIDRQGWTLTMELEERLGGMVANVIEGEAFVPDYTSLAVDDMLFYRPSDFKVAAETLDEHDSFVWSWRLGYDPEFTEACPCLEDLIEHWLTTSFVQSPDYSYLFHSDGALYKTSTYVSKLDMYLPDWRTGKYIPNDLEAAVAAKRSRWAVSAGPHLGPPKPTCITWQLNRVQGRYGSPAAELPETQTNMLAMAYLDGRRVDNEKLYKTLQSDAQRFNPPGARPTHVYASEEASKFWVGCVR